MGSEGVRKLLEVLPTVVSVREIMDEWPAHPAAAPRRDEDAITLATHLESVVTCRKVISTTAKSVTDPLVERRRDATTFFQDEFIHPLEVRERRIRELLAKWVAKQDDRVRRAQARAMRQFEAKYDHLMAAADAADADDKPERAQRLRQQAVELMPSLAEASGGAHTKLPGIQPRRRYRYEVTDIGVLPSDCILADHERIESRVQELGKAAERVIPGIRVFQDTTVAVES